MLYRRVLQLRSLPFVRHVCNYVHNHIQILVTMGKEILIQLPDGHTDYDGDEDENDEYLEMVDDWRFEMSTYNY